MEYQYICFMNDNVNNIDIHDDDNDKNEDIVDFRKILCDDTATSRGRRCADGTRPACLDQEQPNTCADGSEPAR